MKYFYFGGSRNTVLIRYSELKKVKKVSTRSLKINSKMEYSIILSYCLTDNNHNHFIYYEDEKIRDFYKNKLIYFLEKKNIIDIIKDFFKRSKECQNQF